MMKCLKTGLMLSHNGHTMSCDMFGDIEKEVILLKGFGSNLDCDEYDVDVDNGQLLPTVEFEAFMERINPEYGEWTNWTWIVFDTRNRFDTEVNVPDV